MAPLAGFVIRDNRRLQDFAIGLLIFLMGLHIDTTVLMIGSIEWYRGVTKGYEFNMMEMVALAILFARATSTTDPLRKLPKGTFLWLFYCGFSFLSLLSALNLNYVFMSAIKFTKCWVIAAAIFSYLRSERELTVILRSACIMLIYQWIIVMKMKFIDGYYQVRGLFEHQNPLAIYTYMISFPILAAAMAPGVKRNDCILYLFTYCCGAIIVLSALSRAAIAVFALGTVAVVIGSIIDKITIKRISIVALMGLGGLVVVGMMVDTIVARFNDEGNEASGETRDVMNLASLAMVKDKPLGVGWNNFGKAINHPYPYGDVIDDWNIARGQKVDKDYAKGVVESHYYLLLSETGYLGLIFYIVFIAATVWWSLISYFKFRKTQVGAVAAGIFFSLILVYLHSHLERVLTQTKNLALWMLLIGIVVKLYSVKKKKEFLIIED